MRLRLSVAALWPPAGKELTSCLLFVKSNCDFVTFPFVMFEHSLSQRFLMSDIVMVYSCRLLSVSCFVL